MHNFVIVFQPFIGCYKKEIIEAEWAVADSEYVEFFTDDENGNENLVARFNSDAIIGWYREPEKE